MIHSNDVQRARCSCLLPFGGGFRHTRPRVRHTRVKIRHTMVSVQHSCFSTRTSVEHWPGVNVQPARRACLLPFGGEGFECMG